MGGLDRVLVAVGLAAGHKNTPRVRKAFYSCSSLAVVHATVDPAPKDKRLLCSQKEDCVPSGTAGAGHHGVAHIHITNVPMIGARKRRRMQQPEPRGALPSVSVLHPLLTKLNITPAFKRSITVHAKE